MTIHTEHPFDTPDEDRDQVRRLRGRVGGTVSLWTSGAGIERAGLTVSSYLVATGDPGRVVGLLHPDADLLDAVCAAADTIMAVGERSWLQSHGVPCALQVW